MNQITLDFFEEEKKKRRAEIPLRTESQSIDAVTIPVYLHGVEVARIILSSETTRIEFAALVKTSSDSIKSLKHFFEKIASENGSELTYEEDQQGFLKWFDLKPPLKSINASLFTRKIAYAISKALGGEK